MASCGGERNIRWKSCARGWCEALLLGRFGALHVVAVGGRAVGRGLDLGGFLGGAKTSGTVVAGPFHIVFFGQWRDQHGPSRDLADALEDDFGAAVVEFDGAADFDGAAGESADVANIFQVGSEDYDREGASHVVFAEVEEVNASRADFHMQDFAGHALRFAHMLASLANGETIGGEERGGGQ